MDSVKAAITEAWYSLEPKVIIRACKSFRGPLEKCVEENGGNFEK